MASKLANPLSRWGKGIISTSLLVAIIIIVLEAIVAYLYDGDLELTRNSNDRSIFVYLMIFIFAQIFQLYLIVDAVIGQNLIQVIAHFFFNFAIASYSVFQYQQMASFAPAANIFPKIQPYLIGIICAGGASLACYASLTYKLYQEFGWKIYKKIGADPRMKLRYRNYQIFLMLLKVDFFFFIAFSVQFLVLVLQSGDFEFYLTIVALPSTAAFLALAAYGLRNEKKWIMHMFLVGGLMGISYFTFKIYRFYDPSQASKYVASQRFLTFFASICLAAILGTMFNAVVCLKAFNKGLKDRIERQRVERNMTL